MASGGFLPVRQLVLVDLLGLILGIKPSERVVVGVDGDGFGDQQRLVAEMVALTPAISDREIVVVSTEDFVSNAQPTSAAAYYRDRYDHRRLREDLIEPFLQGREVSLQPVTPDQEPRLIEPGATSILIVSGPFLHRPELTSGWDGSLLVHPTTYAAHGGEQSCAAKAWTFYAEQSPAQQARWVVDLSDPARPHLLVVDPEEPVV